MKPPVTVLGEVSRTAEPWPVADELPSILAELNRGASEGERDALHGSFRTLLAKAPIVVWAIDRAGRITLHEGDGLSAFNLRRGDALGKNAFEIESCRELGWLRRVLRGESFAGEVEFSTPPAWFEIRSEPLVGPDGICGAVGLSIDITTRKQAERERDRHFRAAQRVLRGERAAKRRALFLEQASRVLAGSLDQDTTLSSIAHLIVPELADGCIVNVVDARGGWHPVIAYRDPDREAELGRIVERVGLSPKTMLGRVAATGEPLFVPDVDEVARATAVSDAARELLTTLEVVSFVVVRMKARGRVLGLLTMFMGQESERRLDQEDVEFACDLAVHAALAIDNARMFGEQTAAIQRRDEFLSVAAHELRTPLTSLQLAVQMLGRRKDELATQRASSSRHLLDTAERQTFRLAQLVENLLDVSRIATGQLVMNLDPVDLCEVVREAVVGVSLERGGDPTSTITTTIESALPVVGMWDRVRLEQVVTNLLSNAIKYGAERPIAVRVSTTESTARLEVEDHGIGIARDHQEAIFDRFERAVSSRHYGGFGLGLYIVKQIVTALGGTIDVSSELGAGSTFGVTLPLHGAPARPDDASAR